MEMEQDIRYQQGKIYKLVCNITGEVYYGSTKNTLEKRLQKHKEKTHTCMSKQILERGDYKIELIKNYPCNTKRELELEEGKYIRENECINIKIPGRTPKEHYEDNKIEILEKNKQYRDLHKKEISEKSKENYQKNKDKIKKKVNEYREEHKDIINEKNKIYREEHKEELNKKNREKYEEHKEEINKATREDRKNNPEKYRQWDKNKYEKHKEKILEKMKEDRKNNPEKYKQKENNRKNKQERQDKNNEKITCECGAIVRRGGIAEHKRSMKHKKLTECLIID